MKKAYKGNVLFTKEIGKLESVGKGYLVVNDNKVEEVTDKCPEDVKSENIIDFGDKLIIPGFVDIHLHAPQINNTGLGADMQLLEWLDHYTFPEESRYKNMDYAEKSYKALINKLWENGTTSSVMFGSINNESNILLAELLEEAGMKAYIGKVNMDRNSPDFYIEETDKSLIATEDFIASMKKFKNVKPIITPRFVPSCTEELMKGLGNLADKHDLKIQSHLSENKGEIAWVKDLHPDCEDYIDVYEKYGLLKANKTVMAHCVYSEGKELEKLKKYNVTVAHAPVSNGDLASGIAPIFNFIDNDVNVGLCSDISGGHEISMAKVLTMGETFGKLRWLADGEKYNSLGTIDYFYMATKGSGNYFENVGTFEKGYDADFLVIDDSSLADVNDRTIEERLKRFLYIGNPTNIVKRYISGKEIVKPY